MRRPHVPLVLDANVVTYMVLDGEMSAGARRLHEVRPDWLAPALLRHEFTNVCVTYQRAGGLSREECLEVLRAGMDLLARRERTVDPRLVVATALDAGLSAYDAEYVACALSLGGSLVTEDRSLLARAGGVAVSVEDYLAAV